jgi:hypothetical protein
MFHQCPVCGYSELRTPAENHSICPSCGTEFGYDDFAQTHRSLRNQWLASGPYWFSSNTPPPFPAWNGFRQVIEAGFPFDIPAPATKTKTFSVLVPVAIPVLAQYQLQIQMS